MSQTCVIYHPKFSKHGNLVLRERLAPAFHFLIDFLKENDQNRVVIQKAERVEEELILQVHTKQHLARVKEDICYDAARLSAGGAVLAGEMVWTGKARNSFAFTGTAGHHAGRNSYWGFCYINNSALLIQHLRNTYNVTGRFMIIDTDPHPGDGTRDIFENDKNVVHLNFFSDGLPFDRELIRSNKFDIPLPSNMSNRGFLKVLQALTPALAEQFEPELILWNFGHDAHHSDYGGFNLTISAFPEMARIITQVAKDICDDKLVILLSGGSNLWVAKQSITSIVAVLADLPSFELDQDFVEENPEDVRTADNIINKLLKEVV